MLKPASLLPFVAFLFVATLNASGYSEEITPQQREFFEKKIRPVLVKQCYSCHSAKVKDVKGSLLLDTRVGTRKGGDTGHAVVPGNVEESLLIESIRRTEDNVSAMPPKDALSEEVIADFVKWVKMGAPDTRDGKSINPNKIDFQKARSFWAFQQLKKQPIPKLKNSSWAKSNIDHYVMAKLEEQKLTPTKDTDRVSLIRRVSFDLTGLPPTPKEVDAFVNDTSPKAFDKVVDRLLASPRFGERWGRHWLDISRYAESTGKERNYPYPHAWRYRDYVIDAFNNDKPYDQFVQEQIAGDLLPSGSDKQRNEKLVGTGFLTLGPKSLNERNKLQFEMDEVDDQIDTAGRAFLGLTIGCARCHDHKFDPIPTAEYYALAGIFRSTETLAGVSAQKRGNDAGNLIALVSNPEEAKRYEAHSKKMNGVQNRLDKSKQALKKLQATQNKNKKPNRKKAKAKKGKKKITQLLSVASPKKQPETLKQAPKKKPVKKQAAKKKAPAKASPQSAKKLAKMRQQVKNLQQQLAKLKKNAPPAPDRAMGVRDKAQPAHSPLFVKGEIDNLGPKIVRGYISVITSRSASKVNRKQSGRLELAQWLTRRDNPLTARVMVNRIWQHLFGQGIVATVDNFGSLGRAPSHPELLDYLAIRFMDEGWSVKTMIREIVLSRTYQLNTDHLEANYNVDPENRFLWRASRRRLDAEAIRDTILSVSGQIDLTPAKGSPVSKIGAKEIGRQIDADKIALKGNHRSVFLPVLRGAMPAMLKVFDVADPSLVVGHRDVTTAAPQALFMMNSPFVMEQADHAARSLLAEAMSDAERVELAYKRAFGRVPTQSESERVLEFISEYRKSAEEKPSRSMDDNVEAWSSFCQALFASAELRYLY